MNKILYFFDYGNSFGGAANTLLQQLLVVKEAGYEVKAYVSNYYGNISEAYSKVFDNYQIKLNEVKYCCCSHTEDIDIIEVFSCYENICETIQRERPDLVHSVQINPTVELVCRELNIPHIMDIYQAIDDFFALDYTDIFPHYHICDSEIYANSWSKGLQINSTCIRTLVRDFIKRQKVYDHEALSFIAAGQVTPRKNQLEVIKGFHNAIRKGVKGYLDIYGYCKEQYALECVEYVKQNDLSERVSFHGFVTSMFDKYQDADVLICGSKVESYPNVISEALANGLIVITSPVAGVPEVIKDRRNGFVTSGYSAADFEEKIMECWNAFRDKSVNSILAEANKTFEAVHGKENVKYQILEYYKSVIKNSSFRGVLSKDDAEIIFRPIIDRYNENVEHFTYPELIKTKLWYWYHACNVICRAKKKIYIWGAGKMGLCALEALKAFLPNQRIEGFIDRKRTGLYQNHRIYAPTEVVYDNDNVILIAVKNCDEIIDSLEAAKRAYGVDYFLVAPRMW